MFASFVFIRNRSILPQSLMVRSASKSNTVFGKFISPSCLEKLLVFKDQDILVVNKPPGVLSVPGRYNPNSLGQVVFEKFGCEEILSASQMVIHRLDADTSGIVVFARNVRSMRHLHAQFRNKKVEKQYESVIWGKLGEYIGSRGSVKLPIKRDITAPPFMRTRKFIGPKEAITHWEVIEYGKNTTRVNLFPVTGRTHQLRVHMAALGHPICGDTAYGFELERKSCFLSQRMCLHSKLLRFIHPRTGEIISFTSNTSF
eukprot:GSMAST32.ASY1.ANO1.180.1 assembled CDS